MELRPIKKFLSSSPLLIPAVALMAGICLSVCFTGLIVLITGILLCIISFLCHRHYIALILASLSLGSLSLLLHQSQSAVLPVDKPIKIIANIIESKETNSGQSVIAVVKSISAGKNDDLLDINPTKISVTIPSLIPAVKSGFEMTANVTLKTPDTRTYLPDQFNYGDLLLSKDIRYIAFLLPDDIISMEPSNDILMSLRRFRDNISTVILRLPLKAATKTFLNTIITGNSDSFDYETRQAFNKSGLAHILALSGLHVAIFSSILLFIFYPLRLTVIGRFIPLFIIICLWFFALVTGMSPSVTRAVIMATVFLAAFLLQRPHNPLNSLSFAAILILVFDPKALFDISFQLSFLAVTGILLFATRLNPINPRRKVLHTIFGIFAVSISAMTFAGVLSAYHFHCFPLFFLISNVLISPIIPIFIGLGILLIVFSFLGIHISLLITLVDLLYSPIDKVTEFLYRLPYASIQNIYFDGSVLVFLFLFIFSLALILYYHRPVSYIASALSLLAVVIVIGMSPTEMSEGIYILPSSSRTDLYIASNNTLNVLTTAPTSEFSSLTDQISNYHIDYLNKRNIKSVYITSDKEKGNSLKNIVHGIVTFPKGKIALCSSDNQMDKFKGHQKIDYIIVCKGFKGEISDLLRYCSVGTLILSSDLHPSRHDRYLSQCHRIGQEVISLRTEMPPDLNSLLK